MSSDDRSYTEALFQAPPPEVLAFILSLKQEILPAASLLDAYPQSSTPSNRERAFRHCLHRSNDLLLGCIVTGTGGCGLSLEILCRALLENLIDANWVVQSEENAEGYISSSRRELHKVMRVNLTDGYAKLTNKLTGSKMGARATQAFLAKSKPPAPGDLKIEDKAKACGLHDIYSMIYRSLSLSAHGKDFLSATKPEMKWKKVEGLVSAVKSTHRATLLVVDHYLKRGRAVPLSELKALLLPGNHQTPPQT